VAAQNKINPNDAMIVFMTAPNSIFIITI